MCFDPIRGKVLMFGGKTLGAFGTDTNELWSYDGISWTLLNPTGSLPPPTLDAEFVYDSNRGVFVTYGSTTTLGPAADRTWEYDPVTNAWAQKLPPVTPGGLASYGMAFDPANNKIVLYGGQTGSLPVNSDATWLYDGTTWNQVATMNSPGPLERPGMCFHDGLGRTVLFGGSIGSTAVTDNTWLFDGSDWTQVAISGPRPPARADCRMVYDSIRQICVMSGGEPIAGPHFNDTWELDLASMTWTQSPSSFTGIRVAHGLAFDANRGWVVQFGGWNSTTFSMYGDTWEYGVRSETFGTGCPGSNGIPALDACDAPRFGQPYVLSVSNLRMAAGLAVFVMSLTDMPATPLVGLGMPGCTGYVPMDVFLAGAGVGGLASISLLMPNSIYLVDTTIFSQVLSFDPMINPAWLAISNAHKGTLGH